MGTDTMWISCLFGLIALAAGAPNVPRLLLRPRNATPLSQGGLEIVGGKDTYYGEIPHQVAVLRGGPNGSLMCGGSLINENWVLTAAHCCDGHQPRSLGVSAGSYKLHKSDLEQQDIAVKTVIMHGDYNHWTIENDICLLELETPVTMGEYVGAISLPDQNEEYEEGVECQVTGWGTTSEGGYLAKVLQKVTVPVVSDEKCRSAYVREDIFDSNMCAGLEDGGKDSCQGDSGGPMTCGDQLSGIVSWGYGCAEAGYYGVYTQTSYFVEWVNAHIQ